ncbi:hypothetical protein BST16_09195 [Mycobacterium asiaticum DSM 44297]|nr:hypothetical protein BST16_09195 [Mycobacterium asiaticum DSM 44297]
MQCCLTAGSQERTNGCLHLSGRHIPARATSWALKEAIVQHERSSLEYRLTPERLPQCRKEPDSLSASRSVPAGGGLYDKAQFEHFVEQASAVTVGAECINQFIMLPFRSDGTPRQKLRFTKFDCSQCLLKSLRHEQCPLANQQRF